MKIYDIAVVGAGPAGMMAAIRTGQLGKKVLLIERNDSIGKKLLLTGKGRCNITNSARIEIFIEKFGRSGLFLRTAFSRFFNEDLIDFFKSKGLELKIERQGRVFPATDDAHSVTRVLKEYLDEHAVEIRYQARVRDVRKKDSSFELDLGHDGTAEAKKVILATGGASYAGTGSTGDGFYIAQKLGHTIVPLTPGLVPLKTKEPWAKELQGLTLKNIQLTFKGKKKIVSDVGEMLFTHFGISGPLVLDLSAKLIAILGKDKDLGLAIDLKPGMDASELEKKLLSEVKNHGGKDIKNMLKDLLPQNLIPVFIRLSGVDGEKKAHQISRQDRLLIARSLKALPLTVTGALPIEEAMVTCGGVSTKEIDPRTMESKIVPGLYFAGEIIEGGAPSGGYNLQQAFSTGYLAGSEAAHA